MAAGPRFHRCGRCIAEPDACCLGGRILASASLMIRTHPVAPSTNRSHFIGVPRENVATCAPPSSRSKWSDTPGSFAAPPSRHLGGSCQLVVGLNHAPQIHRLIG